ncbi:MAG TPA: hypothetical protein VK209_12700 [Candidatus Sulfotelmatobacter sp.]|nr:hypothetical protein [Candidatus Sulfotelmatobacter sp.]
MHLRKKVATTTIMILLMASTFIVVSTQALARGLKEFRNLEGAEKAWCYKQ